MVLGKVGRQKWRETVMELEKTITMMINYIPGNMDVANPNWSGVIIIISDTQWWCLFICHISVRY